MKKGQANSSEILIVMILVLLTTIPLSSGVLKGFGDRVNYENRYQKGAEITGAIISVSQLGPGNSISISSNYDYEIKDNSLIYYDEEGSEISNPILPRVPDSTAGNGIIEIINSPEGIFFGNSPELIKVEPETVSNSGEISLEGKYLSEDILVYLDGEEVSHLFENDELIWINIGILNEGEHEIYVVRQVSNKDLISPTIKFNFVKEKNLVKNVKQK